MTATPAHLWEVDHPYYMQQGCFYSADHHHEYESFAEFFEEWKTYDDDMNLVFRWDWEAHQPYDEETFKGCEETDHSECTDVLSIFFVMQRKAYTVSCAVKVDQDDEGAVLKYLTPKARKIATLWEPIWQAGAS